MTSSASRYEVLDIPGADPAYLLHAPDGTVVEPVRAVEDGSDGLR